MKKETYVVLALLWVCCVGAARAERKTVCTITVNSADEKEAFRRRLPQDQYRFVELLEKGRSDWLRSSCAKAIQCDVLIVSGHFNAGETFYSDNVAKDDHLRVDELERASCSNSCPGLFSKLKEVYLFGCESLNPDASKYSSSYGESGRERMRRIFANVPVIYGFSSSAPLGATAAMLIDRHFDQGAGVIGTGSASSRLLRMFSRNGMTATRGVGESEDLAGYRHQVCQFFDDRLTPARKLAFIHDMMRRDMRQARAFFERIDRLLAALGEAERQSPAFVHALAEISADDTTRERYLAVERATRQAPLRSRMIALAANLGWLSPESRREELVAMINDVLASPAIGFADVELACSLNAAGDLSGQLSQVSVPAARAGVPAVAAVRACLGSAEARALTLAALASADDRDVQVAQAYLRHRPVSDARELRRIANEIARMPEARAQIRALDTLGRLHIDRQIVDELTRSFAAAKSINLQRAIAEIFLRADLKAIAHADLLGVLRRHRIKSRDGVDLIDAVIGRLQAAMTETIRPVGL
jgi:hypothetical protein